MKTPKRILLIALIAIACLDLQQAKAVPFVFDLGVGNPDVSGYTGPYVQVSVDLTSSTMATITFTSLTQMTGVTNYTYLMGGNNHGVAVNVNASAWTISNFMASNSGTGFSPTVPSDAGSGQMDGFGSFNQTLSGGQYKASASMISFDLTNTSGGTWLSDMNVLTPNADGNLAAAHIFVTAAPANRHTDAVATGFDGDFGRSVPDGGTTSVLLGFALTGLAVMRRYLKI